MNFDIITDLVSVLGRKRLRNRAALIENTIDNDRYSKLYHLILDNEIGSEEEIAVQFGFKSTDSKAYMVFRNRFLSRLAEDVFLLKNSVIMKKFASEKIKAQYYVYLGNILLMLSANTSAAFYYEKALRLANKYDLLELKVSILRFFLNSSYVNGKKNVFNKFKKEMLSTLEQLRIIQTSKLYFEESILIVESKETISVADLQKIEKKLNYMDSIYDLKETGVESKWIKHNLGVLYFSLINNIDLLKKELALAESLIEKHPNFQTTARRFRIYLYNLDIAKKTGNLPMAQEYINLLEGLYAKYTLNWFFSKKNALLFYLFVRDIKNAYNLYTEIIDTPHFNTHSKIEIESWNLLGAHVAVYLKATGEGHLLKNAIKNLKLQNEIHLLKKDKAGANVSFILITLLNDYLDGNLDEIINRKEALEIYMFRYLKDKTYARTRIVFSTLIQLIGIAFNEKKAKALVKAGQNKLKSTPSWGEIESIEIIPFETYLSFFMGAK